MNLLRAKVFNDKDGWVIRLDHLDIMGEGPDESSMLRDLEEALIAEHGCAEHFGLTPFVRLLKSSAKAEMAAQLADDQPVHMRKLNLPMFVRRSLASALRCLTDRDFKIELRNEAVAA